MPTKMVKRDARKQWEFSLTFDEHLDALIDAEGLEDPIEQMVVCNALCALGLADHKMFCDDELGSQEDHYKSTKAMRKLVKEYLPGFVRRYSF